MVADVGTGLQTTHHHLVFGIYIVASSQLAVATFETFDELLLNFTVIDDHNFALIEFFYRLLFLVAGIGGLGRIA